MGDIPITGDVAVIGAGLSGALMAYHLAEARQRVIVLEAKEAASGATGRGHRVAFLGTPQPFPLLAGQVGEEKARRIWAATIENAEEAESLLERLAVPYRHSGCLRLAANTEEAYALQRSVEVLEALGVQAEIEDATEMGFVAALETEADILFDPVALTRRLLEHPNITLQEWTEVKSLESRGEDVYIWAKGAYLRSHAVIIAAGAYAVHLHPFLAKHLRVMPIQAVECEVASPPGRPLVWHGGALTLQPPPGGEKHRLVAWARGVDEAVWPLVEEGARLLCPQATPGQRNVAWIAEGEDSMPLIGGLPGEARMYTLAGLGGWGLSWAFTAARRLAKLMIDGDEPSLLHTERFTG